MNKNVFKGLLVMWLVLIGFDLWFEQYALIAVTGLGITVYSYYNQQVKRLSNESKTSIMNELNEKTVSFVVLSFLFVLIVGLYSTCEPFRRSRRCTSRSVACSSIGG